MQRSPILSRIGLVVAALCYNGSMSDKSSKLPLPLKILAWLVICWASLIVLSITSIGIGALLFKVFGPP